MCVCVCVCVCVCLSCVCVPCIARQNMRAPSKSARCMVPGTAKTASYIDAGAACLHLLPSVKTSPTAGNLGGRGAPGLIQDLAGRTCGSLADGAQVHVANGPLLPRKLCKAQGRQAANRHVGICQASLYQSRLQQTSTSACSQQVTIFSLRTGRRSPAASDRRPVGAGCFAVRVVCCCMLCMKCYLCLCGGLDYALRPYMPSVLLRACV